MERPDIAAQLAEARETIAGLRSQLEREKVLMECVRTLALESDVQKAVDRFLQYLGGYYKADRVVIFEIDYLRDVVNNTYEWCAPGVPSRMADFQGAPLEYVAGWVETFKDDHAHNIFQREVERSAIGGVLSDREVSGLLISPLFKAGTLTGFLGADNAGANAGDPMLLRLAASLITEEFQKRQLVRALGTQEYTDRLTGLYNRNKYLKTLEDYRQEPPESLAVFFLDLNGLKELNEQGGHDAGDRFICKCADVLHELSLEAYRVDGDEFVILMPNVTLAAARAQEETLRTALRALESSGVSLGMAWEEAGVDVAALISEADDRMYAEKQVYYRQILSQNTGRRTGIATDLLRDIRDGRFAVYFQPQVELKTGFIYGGEALVRKLDEEGRIIPPNVFVPAYEGEGIISHLDFHVLELACTWIKCWREELGAAPSISVNFSRLTLMEPDVVRRVKAICRKFGVPACQLTIEVTESAGKLTREQLLELVQGLQRAGFSVSLDDFGSRYSNLSILTSVDFQLIKLDKSLIDNIGSQEKCTKIVSNLIHLLKDTIATPALAEGVETAEQVALLQNFNCDYVQGYYFSRPVPAQEFTEMLRERRTFPVPESEAVC